MRCTAQSYVHRPALTVEDTGKGADACTEHLGDRRGVIVFVPIFIVQHKVFVCIERIQVCLIEDISNRIPVLGIVDNVGMLLRAIACVTYHLHGVFGFVQQKLIIIVIWIARIIFKGSGINLHIHEQLVSFEKMSINR